LPGRDRDLSDFFPPNRGMRTHIRMHIDRKTGDFNEENYISCILDGDNTEIPPAAAHKTPSPEILEQQRKKSPSEHEIPVQNGSPEMISESR
jgi:hypothetical protein